MRQRVTQSIAPLLLAAAVVSAGELSGGAGASVSLAGASTSPLAASLQAADGDGWQKAETNGVIVYARSTALAQRVVEPAEFALREGARRLGIDALARPVKIFIVDGDDLWRSVVEAEELRADSVGMQLRDEVYLRVSETVDADRVIGRLTHEIAHVLVREICPRGLPLWLDEGTATYLGDVLAGSYAGARGLPWPPQGDIVRVRGTSLPELRRIEGYPKGLTALRSFYASGRAIAEWVTVTLGGAALGDALEVFCEPGAGTFESVMLSRFNVPDTSLNILQKRLDGWMEFRPESVRHGH